MQAGEATTPKKSQNSNENIIFTKHHIGAFKTEALRARDTRHATDAKIPCTTLELYVHHNL
jgi:hypothetical protein